MASILSFANRMFRTRNPMRDASTDRERMQAVETAIENAIESARRERDGLKRRVDAYYTQVSALLDEAAEYGERSDVDERAISDAERAAGAGRRRIEAIEAQLAHFAEMLAQARQQRSDSAA